MPLYPVHPYTIFVLFNLKLIILFKNSFALPFISFAPYNLLHSQKHIELKPYLLFNSCSYDPHKEESMIITPEMATKPRLEV
jgi:hypothetical protein